MEFESKYQWVSERNISPEAKVKTLEVLEQELVDIKNSLEVLDERRRVLANLSKLY